MSDPETTSPTHALWTGDDTEWLGDAGRDKRARDALAKARRVADQAFKRESEQMPTETTIRSGARNPAAGLTKAQRAAFERMTVGDDSYMPSKVRDSLVAKGLIVQTGERCLVTIFGKPVMTAVFEVPTAVHMQWCAWCAENVKEDVDV